jgi:hypothetical protein
MPIAPDWFHKLQEFTDRWKRKSLAREYLGDEYIGDNPFPHFVLTERANSWDDVLAWFSEFPISWCFRGQRESEWSLLTSLDRAVRRDYSSDVDGIRTTGYLHLDREVEGLNRLAKFRKYTSRYVLDPPADGDLASWLALMQHFGTATRFLDWTMSPFVAAFFAFEEEASGDSKSSAIWGLDLKWLERRGRELLGAESFAFSSKADRESLAKWENGLIAECREATIIKVNPLVINERMAAQQSILLCKLFHQAFFSQTLMRMMIHEIPPQPVVRKLEVHTSNRTEFLTRLRSMNIHKAALFPDAQVMNGVPEVFHEAV